MTGIIQQKFQQRAKAVNSLLCVGLDSRMDHIPQQFLDKEYPQFAFNQWIIDQTHTFVSAYKPNIAFYEARGADGWRELELTMNYLREKHPDIVTICDAKRADIGSTNQGYVQAIFDHMNFDAITLQPYLGQEALQPFLERADKANIILCRTSNVGAGELQELMIEGVPIYQHLAQKIATDWNNKNNCMLVVGATAPSQLEAVRQIVGDMVILVPGIGTQGGDVETVLNAGLTDDKLGLIINVSRAIIFADNPADKAQYFRDAINQYR